jgi:hypothetical protein
MMPNLNDTRTWSIIDFASVSPLPLGSQEVVINVPASYLSDDKFDMAGVEGLAVQRLLTLSQRTDSLKFVWSAVAARRVIPSPALHPLAAVALCLNNAKHVCQEDSSLTSVEFGHARQALLGFRLGADMFSERQTLICLDHEKPSLPFDLYDPLTNHLRRDDEFESLFDDLLFSQRGAGFSSKRLQQFRLPLAVILRELLQNTDDHAKANFDGSVLKPNAIRGLLVKRILQERRVPTRNADKEPPVPCLEFTIFDSGIGYYNSYRRQLLRGQARGEPVQVGDRQADTIRRFELGTEVPMETEYAILLKCLERHSESAIPDPRPGHRGLGLYEVLRALKMMQGMFEVRTGRIHGYRSFLQGELRLQLEPESSDTRPGMPKASLLDVPSKYLPRPTQQELVRGSLVRVVIPLI